MNYFHSFLGIYSGNLNKVKNCIYHCGSGEKSKSKKGGERKRTMWRTGDRKVCEVMVNRCLTNHAWSREAAASWAFRIESRSSHMPACVFSPRSLSLPTLSYFLLSQAQVWLIDSGRSNDKLSLSSMPGRTRKDWEPGWITGTKIHLLWLQTSRLNETLILP